MITVSPRSQKDLVDQIEALQRARGDQDVVGCSFDAAHRGELAGDEGAQARVPDLALAQVVGRELAALAPQHPLGGRHQGLDRHDLGIVVAACEVVAGMAAPARGRRWQVGGEQLVEGDHEALLVQVADGGQP